MNTMKTTDIVKKKKTVPWARLGFRLWCAMMTLVMLAAAFIWIVQVYFFDASYIESSVTEITSKVEQVSDQLEHSDLADDPNLITYLSMSVSGKMIIVNDEHELIEAYSMGYPIALASDSALLESWCNIQQGEYYHYITDREAFHDIMNVGPGNAWLYIGVPVTYYGMDTYLLMMHPFADLYSMLEVNRQQFAVFCILLTIAASILAAFFSRKFTKPILKIKTAVDSLAAGDLDAVPDVKRKDELGQLSISMEELGIALKRVDVLRKEVIANVSHELRTPLAHIGGYAEMANDLHSHDEEKRKEDLDFVVSEVSRMTEMVNDIMDYSQLQAGYLPLNLDNYNLCEVIETESDNCKKAAQENHITLHYETDCKEYPVHIDALKITQVLRNLIYNAINHTADGETITVKITKIKDGVRVSVINPGEPIPEEERDVIWERYQRAQHQGSRKQGTGIGLSIVASILNAHKMTYGVVCENGFTIFWFEYNGFNILKSLPAFRA